MFDKQRGKAIIREILLYLMVLLTICVCILVAYEHASALRRAHRQVELHATMVDACSKYTDTIITGNIDRACKTAAHNIHHGIIANYLMIQYENVLSLLDRVIYPIKLLVGYSGALGMTVTVARLLAGILL